MSSVTTGYEKGSIDTKNNVTNSVAVVTASKVNVFRKIPDEAFAHIVSNKDKLGGKISFSVRTFSVANQSSLCHCVFVRISIGWHLRVGNEDISEQIIFRSKITCSQENWGER